MPFSLPSFAKINLQLRVLGKRDEYFHEIFTVLQTVSLHDTLSFEKAENEIEILSEDPNVPTDETNLIVQAAEHIRSKFRIKSGATIRLEKRIPSPGGLGGGSSNAAVALIALSRLWELDISESELIEIAASLGSDVPFFLFGGTAVGTGTGSTISPTDDLNLGPTLIVSPKVQVSTKEAYAGLNANRLTSGEAESILSNYRFGAIDGLKCVNDFEKTVFAAFPEIEFVKQTLLELGANAASMSGSGASVFGIFDNEETRQTALKALGEKANWRSFAVAAVSRNEYRERLGM
ncbi:MAG: 4-(cytidine 5'-diphospho)-2-C-methyl-D-erythritol kinase [Pyrinomonadaceae bacterium]